MFDKGARDSRLAVSFRFCGCFELATNQCFALNIKKESTLIFHKAFLRGLRA